jgi:hypothetical protein
VGLSGPPPVAVFAYRRPDLLGWTLEALAACRGFRGGRVHVFCDAPRGDEFVSVEKTRAIAAQWCRSTGARMVLRDANHGFHNITDAMTELCAAEGCAISLEDDHCADHGLLEFLDTALAAYRDEPRVFQVAALVPGLPFPPDAPDTFFLPAPMTMGWATWDRAWSHFCWQIDEDALADDDERQRFDFGGSYPAARLLERARRGEFDSYFIRWYLAMFRAGGLALCSRRTLVRNIGLASGVHGMAVSPQRERFFHANWDPGGFDPRTWKFPERVEVDTAIFAQFTSGLRRWRAGR